MEIDGKTVNSIGKILDAFMLKRGDGDFAVSLVTLLSGLTNARKSRKGHYCDEQER